MNSSQLKAVASAVASIAAAVAAIANTQELDAPRLGNDAAVRSALEQLTSVLTDEDHEEVESELPCGDNTTISIPSLWLTPSKTTIPRTDRIRRIRLNIDEVQNVDPKVGDKRSQSAVFGELDWIGNLCELYSDKRGALLHLKPPRLSISEEKIQVLHNVLEMILQTGTNCILTCKESVVAEMIDLTLRIAASECIDVVNVDVHVNLKSQELGVNVHADWLLTRNGVKKMLVVHCKRGDGCFSKGVAQMVLGAEALLSEILEQDPTSNECVYGIATNLVVWQILHLNRHQARFCDVFFAMNKHRESLEDLTSIVSGLLKTYSPEIVGHTATA